MRAFAALLLLAGLCEAALNANQHGANNVEQKSTFVEKLMSNVLRRLDRRQDATWPEEVVKCGRTLGVAKCFKAFSAWRAENAIDSLSSGAEVRFNVRRELDMFPWQRFANNSDEELDERLSDGAGQLLRYRSLSLDIYPGYQLELDSKQNGTLNVDVCTTSEGESRSMSKKMRKRFYRMVPFMLVPGLLMAAVLPFVLPALKMMTVAVGMLNNMALSGAVFTLLRNNAFADKYHKKIIYVNEGYKNEKHLHHHFADESQDVYNYYGDEEPGIGNHVPVAPPEWLYADAVDYNNKNYKTKRNDKENAKYEVHEKIKEF